MRYILTVVIVMQTGWCQPVSMTSPQVHFLSEAACLAAKENQEREFAGSWGRGAHAQVRATCDPWGEP